MIFLWAKLQFKAVDSVFPKKSAMPLPPGGLPEGWTMDQWVAYGHLWYEQNT